MDLGRVGASADHDGDPVDTVPSSVPSDIDRLIEGAPRNTDDNARVEFSAPKTLGLYTIDENLAMLRAYTSDPADYILPEIGDPLERDVLQLELAESLLQRGYAELATAAVARSADESLAERRDRLRESIERYETSQ